MKPMTRMTLTPVRTAVAALSLAAVGLLGAPAAHAAPSAAAACPWTQGAPASNLNPYSQTDYASGNAPVRMGPYGECGSVGTIPSGGSVSVNCYVTNSFGNTWSYIRGYGWIWDNNLRNGGSTHPCRF
ncbi:hypothetical protein SLA_4210 [Streptomyces laurentii]|uniref:SH3 domain-containing protein n=1 Tax=Streptomyces laurentii TaxID=39478 RepID=A0A169NR90_STRLU|nr:hypothetical protein SLA_4210 [Streptomyces laurentii]